MNEREVRWRAEDAKFRQRNSRGSGELHNLDHLSTYKVRQLIDAQIFVRLHRTVDPVPSSTTPLNDLAPEPPKLASFQRGLQCESWVIRILKNGCKRRAAHYFLLPVLKNTAE